jgi:hypothetical protein
MPVVEMRIGWVQEINSMYELMGQLIVSQILVLFIAILFFIPGWLHAELRKIYVQIQITVQFSDHFLVTAFMNVSLLSPFLFRVKVI